MSSVLRFDEWQDSDGNPVYDGSGGPLATPAILQVVQTVKTDIFSTASSTYTPLTGLTATITPSSASSKILVSLNIAFGGDADGVAKLKRDSTDIALGTGTATNQVTFFTRVVAAAINTVGTDFLDTPATTSAVTYSVDVKFSNIGSGATLFVNRRGSNTFACTVSSITLMEVAG